MLRTVYHHLGDSWKWAHEASDFAASLFYDSISGVSKWFFPSANITATIPTAKSVHRLATMPMLAREKTDVLVMRNGDRMTCEIKGLSAGVLYVSFDYIEGTTSVDWSKVARVESTQLFVVKTESGTVYTGTLESTDTVAGRPVKIHVIETPEKGTVVERSQIVKMVGTSDKFWERFNGAISLGVIYSKGNQSTQYTLGSEAAYVRERWGAQVSFDSNLSSSAGVNASTRNSLRLGAFHLLPSKNWFYSGLSDFLQSSEQGISLQST